MIPVAYAVLVVSLFVWARRGATIETRGTLLASPALVLMLGVAFTALLLAGLWLLFAGSSTLAIFIGASLLAGSVLFVGGLGAPEPIANWFRATGWLLMVVALLVPSTLTLLLLLVAPMIMLIGRPARTGNLSPGHGAR